MANDRNIRNKILITGNPVDGFRYFGPFSNDEIDYASLNIGEADWWVAYLEHAKADNNTTVVLVAFEVETNSEQNPQEELAAELGYAFGNENTTVTSWWIAEDNRIDGSDNESAIFIPKSMTQTEALMKVMNSYNV